MTVLELLDWEDEEMPTKETVPYSFARRTHPSAPLAIVSLTDEPSEDSVVEPSAIELAPPTEVDPSCPVWSSDWTKDAPTLRTPVPPQSGKLAPDSYADATLERLDGRWLAPSSGRHTMVSEVDSSIAETLDQDDDFDLRDTTRHASTLPPAPALPRSMALPLVQQVATSLSSLPPTVLDEAPPDLAAEVQRLRGWVRLTSAISVCALTGCAILGTLLSKPAPSPQTLQRQLPQTAPVLAAQAAPRPAQPSTQASAATPEVVPPPDPKIQVVLSLYTPGANVMLAAHGEPARQLTGPWPMTLDLLPGSYSIFAAGGGHKPQSIPLHLTPDMTHREVAIRRR
ncbi:MAG: hypothetical protein DRI90_25955 [Deltaproteobacteria bacterium]|nr:MAG: hypothetical protein DRI90_25955 [Deltaproteobacteria bacterium]